MFERPKRNGRKGVGFSPNEQSMQEKFAFLLQDHFLSYCKKTLGNQWEGREIAYFSYQTLKELQQIFLREKGHYDAFLVSGVIPLDALWEVDTPPYTIKDSLESYLINTYRILLGILFQRGPYDPTRIGIDFLGEDMPLVDILEEDRLPELVYEHSRHLLGMTAEELAHEEERLVEDYKRRCRAGKLDIVITYYNSVVQGLAGENVECIYSYPSRNTIFQTLQSCVKKIQTEKLRRKQSAVIRIHPKYNILNHDFTPNRGLELLSLKSTILEFFRLHQFEPLLRDDLTDIELYLTTEQLGTLTGQFTYFDLPTYLANKVGFQGFISLGTGEDLSSARRHAMKAQDYRSHLEQDVCVYMDEHRAIFSLPIHQYHEHHSTKVFTEDMEDVANRCHLSAETIYRVISVMQQERTNLLTSEELIQDENFSLRVANRVLNALVLGGCAEIVGQRRAGNKGRPKNLHRIMLDF